MWSLYRGGLLIEVVVWAGLTVLILYKIPYSTVFLYYHSGILLEIVIY